MRFILALFLFWTSLMLGAQSKNWTVPAHWVLIRIPTKLDLKDAGPSVVSSRHIPNDCEDSHFQVCSRAHSDVVVLCSAVEWLMSAEDSKKSLCFNERHIVKDSGYFVYGSNAEMSVPLYFIADTDISYRALTFHDDAPHSHEHGDHHDHPQSMRSFVEMSVVVPNRFTQLLVRRHTDLNEDNSILDASMQGALLRNQHRFFEAQSTPEEIAANRNITVTRHQHLDPHRTRTVTFLASGYLAGDLSKFLSDVEASMGILRSRAASRYSPSPWDRYFYLFNIYSVFEPSAERGASRPQGPGFNCPGYMNDCGPRESRNNLDCAYGSPAPSRLGCSYEKSKALASFAPASDIIVVLVNDNDYGGTGSDRYCVLSVGSGDHAYLLIHEIAHSVGMLGDEYTYGFSDLSGIDLPNCARSNVLSEIAWKPLIDQGKVPAAPFAGCSFDNYFRPTQDSCLMASGEPTTLCPVCLDAVANRMLTVTPGLNLAAPMCPPEGFDVYLNADESASLTLNHRYIILNSDVSVVWTLPWGEPVTGVYAITVAGSSLPARSNVISVVITDNTPLMSGNRPAAATQTFQFRIYKRTPADTTLTTNECVASTGVSYMYQGVCLAPEGCNRETVIHLYEAKIAGTITEDDADKAVKAAAVVFSVLGLVAIAVALGFICYRKKTNPQSVYEFSTAAKAVWISSAVFSCFVLIVACCAIVYVAQYLPETVIFGDALFIAGLVLGIVIYLTTLGTFVSILSLSVLFNTVCSILLTMLAIAIFIVSVVMCDIVVNREEKGVVDMFAKHWRSTTTSDPSLVCSTQEYFSCSGFYYACSPVLSEYCPVDCDSQNRNPNACLPVWQAFVWDKLRPAAICGLLLAFLMLLTSILTIVLCVLKRKATDSAAGRRSHRKNPQAPVRALTANERKQLKSEFDKADKNQSGTLEGEEIMKFVHAVFPDDDVAEDEAEELMAGGPKTFDEIINVYFPFLKKQVSNPQVLTQKEAEEAESLVELHRLKLAKMDRFIEASGALSPEALEAIYSKHRNEYVERYGPNVPMHSDSTNYSPREELGGNGVDLDGDGVDDVDGDALLKEIKAAARACEQTIEGKMLAGLSPQELEGLRNAWRNLHPSVVGHLSDAEIDRYYQWSHEAVLESREHFVRWKQLLNVRGTGQIKWAEFCFPYVQRALLKAARDELRSQGKEVTMPGAYLNRQAAVEDYGEAVADSVFLPYEHDVPIERLVAMGLRTMA